MAEGSVAVHSTNGAVAASTATRLDVRKRKLGQLLEAKREQGYQIESQSDTEAVLFTRGHRSWFGLFGSGKGGARMMISVDEQGAAKTRKLSTSG
jgi:hypothetical protein